MIKHSLFYIIISLLPIALPTTHQAKPYHNDNLHKKSKQKKDYKLILYIGGSVAVPILAYYLGTISKKINRSNTTNYTKFESKNASLKNDIKELNKKYQTKEKELRQLQTNYKKLVQSKDIFSLLKQDTDNIYLLLNHGLLPDINEDIAKKHDTLYLYEYINLGEQLEEHLGKQQTNDKKEQLNEDKPSPINTFLFNLLIASYEQTKKYQEEKVKDLEETINILYSKCTIIKDVVRIAFMNHYQGWLTQPIIHTLTEKTIKSVKQKPQLPKQLKEFPEKELQGYIKKCLEVSWNMHVVNIGEKIDLTFYPESTLDLSGQPYDSSKHESAIPFRAFMPKEEFDDERTPSLSDLCDEEDDNIPEQKINKSNHTIQQCLWPSIYYKNNTIKVQGAEKIKVILKYPN